MNLLDGIVTATGGAAGDARAGTNDWEPSETARSSRILYMKMKTLKRRPTKRAANTVIEQEPIGIVISRGTRHEDVPVVWAYVWGPAPEPTDSAVEAGVA